MMFLLNSRKDDVDKEVAESNIRFGERRASLKLDSDTVVAGECKRQFPCVYRDQDDRSASIWRFLNWVAYDRNLAGRGQIADDERLRCPLMSCRQHFYDQNKLLEHVFRCSHFSNGRYWCFHCEKVESFAPSPVPPFRKERLSVRAKRILRWLGSKSHHNHETLDSSDPFKGSSDISNNQLLEYIPGSCQNLSIGAETDSSKIPRELPDNDYPCTAELNEANGLPAELYPVNGSATIFELASYFGSDSLQYSANNEGTVLASDYAGTGAPQELPVTSFSTHESPSQFHMKSKSRSAVSEDNRPRPQPFVSPQSPGLMFNSYAEGISESPTDAEFSGDSLFSKAFESDISPPSTRNSTMQSFSQSSLVEEPAEYPPALPVIPNIAYEMPGDVLEDKFIGGVLASGNPVDALDPLPSTEKEDLAPLSSAQWHTPKDLLRGFWKVLKVHAVESSERLKALPNNPVIGELLNMTADEIAYTGLFVWKKMVEGCPPATIAHLYALVHIAFASAIVNFDDQIEKLLEGLFTDSLAIGARVLSGEDTWTYAKIVLAIWSTPTGGMRCRSSDYTELSARPGEASIDQPWAKGKANAYPIDVDEHLTRSLHVREVPGPVKSHSYEGNKILNVLTYLMDVFEGMTLCSEDPLADGSLPYYSRDANFIQAIKQNITASLIGGYFQSAPSMGTFVQVVRNIEGLVDVGKVRTIHEVKVALLWAARNAGQSMELYDLFSKRVHEFYSNMCYQLPLEPLQTQTCLQRIDTMCNILEAVIYDATQPGEDIKTRKQLGIGPDITSCRPKQDNTRLQSNVNASAVDRPPQTNKVQAGPSRVTVKRKRSWVSSASETGPSPLLSSCSKALSKTSEVENNRCPHCPFRPQGEPRWFKRTLTRHRQIHLEEDHKESYLCSHDGCHRSYSRSDNLAAHIRKTHQGNKLQSNLDITSSSQELFGAPRASSLWDANPSPNSYIRIGL